MYLVLVPERHSQAMIGRDLSKGEPDENYKGMFTSNIETVAGTMRKFDGTKVYKIDHLPEIMKIDVTFEEVTKETLDG